MESASSASVKKVTFRILTAPGVLLVGSWVVVLVLISLATAVV